MDTLTTLRQSLPAALHHLAEPLAHYLDATLELRKASDLEEALTELQGKEIQLDRVALQFGKGNNIGDVRVRDVAGRDVVNITLNIAGSAHRFDPYQMNDSQLKLLHILSEASPRGFGSIQPAKIAEVFGWSEQKARSKIGLLSNAGFITLQDSYIGQGNTLLFRMTPEGDEFLERHKNDA